MASEKTKTAIIVGIVALIVVLILGGFTFLILKVRAHTAQERALARLKADNPVEYYILHTPAAQSEDELKNEMVGKWQLTGAKSRRTGGFVVLQPGSGYYFKSFTLTNWAIVTYDADSNVLYSAGGHYTLRGDSYTESTEEATGMMTRYLGAHPGFRIRMDGDNYYQMGSGKNPSIEEMWHRVEGWLAALRPSSLPPPSDFGATWDYWCTSAPTSMRLPQRSAGVLTSSASFTRPSRGPQSSRWSMRPGN